MTRRRGTAVATALLLAALATAGCGLGAGAEVGNVQLTVTREFGAVPMLDRSLAAKESDSVMRLLEGEADVSTRYGGGYVHSIDGVAEEQRGGDPYDWFFYVDGVESQIGAAEYELKGGEQVWWDYRNWSATNHVPAVVGSWPAPFEGESQPVSVECEGAVAPCEGVRDALEGEGVTLASGSPEKAIRVMVGTWDRLRSDPTARQIENGPAESGVYADFQVGVRPLSAIGRQRTNAELVGLDEVGEPARSFAPDTGLIAATSRYGGPPVWVVTGATPAAVRGAAEALDAEHLRDHYAVAIASGKSTPLPLEGR